jgi:glycogen synthase
MPANMEFMDIRKGSDVEFGQSIYEPFGIAQLEPLTFGGICVFTNVCGCLGFLRDTTGGADVKNAIVADYTKLTAREYPEIEDILQIEQSVRNRTEAAESERVAMQICSRLPRNEAEVESMIKAGYELAKDMDWDTVVKKYLLIGLQSVCKVPDELHIS